MSRLSIYALDILQLMTTDPIVDLDVNRGCSQKLITEGYAEWVKRPSPFKVDNGAMRNHLAITDKGRRVLL